MSAIGTVQRTLERFTDKELIRSITDTLRFHGHAPQMLRAGLETRSRSQLIDLALLVAILDRMILLEEGRKQ